MDFKTVSELVFKNFGNYDISINSKIDKGGYYVFEAEEDYQFINFKIDGIKHWKFGLWLSYADDTKNNFRIELFGQHEDYIDKFKPTCSPKNMRFEFTYDFEKNKNVIENDFWLELCDFMDEVHKLKTSPLIYQYMTYGPDMWSHESFLGYHINWFWFYKIELPIRKFCQYELNTCFAKFIKFLFRLKYRKCIVDVKNLRGEYFFTYVRFDITFPKSFSEDKIESIIENNLLLRLIDSNKFSGIEVNYYTDDEL